MNIIRYRSAPKVAGLLFVLASLASLPAQATTAIRTFVASNGNDVNACTRTSPCRTFGAAIAQTDSGGEVIVLDSAGYGPFTITKSVSVVCPAGIYASISLTTGAGITVNGSGITVLLKGLSLVGQNGNGSNGIVFQSGDKLYVEDCSITNPAYSGIQHNAPGGSLYVNNTRVANAYAGVYLYTLGASGTVTQANIDHCRLVGNTIGVNCYFGSDVTVTNTIATKGTYGFEVSGTMQDFARLHLVNCISSYNSYGIQTLCTQLTGLVLVANSMIIRNDTQGLDAPNGGYLATNGGNVVAMNSGNSDFNLTLAKQ